MDMFSENQLPDSKERVRSQICSDINHYLSTFNDYSLGQKTLAKRADVHVKTIKRICNGENSPGHLTILKIYRVLLSENDHQKLISLLPTTIRETLSLDSASVVTSDVSYSAEIRREVLSDKAFCEIYFMIDAGGVTKELVTLKFGEHGLHILKRMKELDAISFLPEGRIELGRQRLGFDPEVIKVAGLSLSSKYSKPEKAEMKGENFVSLYVESLPDEAYQEWLAIDKDAFLKKAKIADKYRDIKSGKRVFTYMATDTFIKE